MNSQHRILELEARVDELEYELCTFYHAVRELHNALPHTEDRAELERRAKVMTQGAHIATLIDTEKCR